MPTNIYDQRVAITLTIDDWAHVVAAVGLSAGSLEFKDRVNSIIVDTVGQTKQVAA